VPLTDVHDSYLMLAIAEGFGETPVTALLQPDLDPAAWLSAPPEPPQIPPRVAARLRRADLAAEARSLAASAARLGLGVLTPAAPDFPERLRAMPLRPLVLFVRGDRAALGRGPAVAFVGSRTPTPYGTEAAELLATALARAGTPLWSGLARGIDGIAHTACTDAGVPTVAVLAGGLDTIYPPEHQDLAERIVRGGGCLVSELPPGHRARRGHFVRRNRILAAGASAIVVAEASLSSGALHTARFGAECGTDVFALPGPWRSERSQGCHRLLAEGAMPIENTETVLQALGLRASNSPQVALALHFGADQERLLRLLGDGPRPTDLLQRESGLERPAFVRAMFTLERDGAIVRLPGDLWRRGAGKPESRGTGPSATSR
jgi:DNA processing protein